MPEWLNIIIRSFVSLIYLFFLTKLIGKRQLSQLTIFEYIVGIIIGEVAGFVATDMDGPMLYGLMAMTIYAVFPVLIRWIALKSKAVRNFVDGNGTILIKDGKVLEDNLKKERMTVEELMEQLRLKNAFKVADVEFAVMEANGAVSVLLKSQNQPITPKHLGVQVSPSKEPQAVIMDGVIMDEPLATLGLNRQWIKTELEKAGVALENVFLGQADDTGQLYLDLYDDKIQVPKPQLLKLTYAVLKKCQADLEMYALSTQNEQSKKMYEQQAKQLQTIIQSVTPLMTH